MAVQSNPNAPSQASTGNPLDNFFAGVLRTLKLPVTYGNLVFLEGQAQVEGTSAKNNPLATTLTQPGSVPLPGNSAGVQQYPTAQAGINATASTLSNYPGYLMALSTGNALQVSYSNPPSLVQSLSTWSGNANNPSAGFNYFQKVKLAAQGNPSGGSAADIGSFDFSSVPGAAKHIPGVQQAVSAYDAAVSVGSFLGKLGDPNFWIRALQIAAGGVMILVGIYLLARQVGLAPDVPSPIRSAAGAVPSVA